MSLLKVQKKLFLAVAVLCGFTPSMAQQQEVLPPKIPQEILFQNQMLVPKQVWERQLLVQDLDENTRLEVFPAPPCLAGDYYVAVQLYYDGGDQDVTKDWTENIEVSLYHKASTPLWTKSLNLDWSNQILATTAFHHEAISCDAHYELRFSYEEGSAPKEHVYIRTFLFEKPARGFDPEAHIKASHDQKQDQVIIQWDYFGHGAGYDLEWVYVDAYDISVPKNSQEAFKSRDAIRVRTYQPYYEHTFLYPEGKVFYRVRAIGGDLNSGLGKWFYGSEAITVSNVQPNVSWHRASQFIEDANNVGTFSIYDGSNRLRQEIFYSSGKDDITVVEHLYDFEGREAISTLPVPVQSSVKWYPDLVEFKTTDPIVSKYTSENRYKVHFDNGSIQNSALADNSPISNYYSSGSSMKGDEWPSVPNGDGYAFTQKIYARDNTGTVSKTLFPGRDFSVQGAEAAQEYRGQVSQDELDRIFGKDVRAAAFYSKILRLNVDGENTVTYQNQFGQNVASAQVTESERESPVLVDLAAKNIIEGGERVIQHTFLNTIVNHKYVFQYTLEAEAEIECAECLYDLELFVTDSEGDRLMITEKNQGLTSEVFRIFGISPEMQAKKVFNFTTILPKQGNYTLHKRLIPQSVSPRDVIEYVAAQPEVKAMVQNIREQDKELECAWCDYENQEVDGAILETVDMVVHDQIANLLEEMQADLGKGNGDIASHDSYCLYQFMEKNRPSLVFEQQLAFVQDWEEAKGKGFTNLIESDPLFNDESQSGFGYKEAMQERLETISLLPYNAETETTTSPFQGSLEDLIDPWNKNFFVGYGGLSPAEGVHVLYMDIAAQRTSSSDEAFNNALQVRKWELYKTFYLQTRRGLMASHPEIANCEAAYHYFKADTLAQGQTFQFPLWSEKTEPTISGLEWACHCQFSDEDQNAISAQLVKYWEGHPENFLHVILVDDLTDSEELIEVSTVIDKYGCSLEMVAVEDYLVCLEEVKGMPELVLQRPLEQSTSKDSQVAKKVETSSRVEGESLNTASPEQASRFEGSKENSSSSRQWNVVNSSKAFPDESEYQALLALYKKTGGTQWTHREGWQAATDKVQSVANWYGVITDVNGHVVALRLENNNLTGVIPSEISQLHKLQYLDFGSPREENRNQIGGEIPLEIGSLKSLVFLDLQNNNLEGRIPETVYYLTELRYLYINNNKLTGGLSSKATQLVNLAGLYLNHNSLNGSLPNDLGKLSRLKNLNLSDNRFTGQIPKTIGNLGQLVTLDLSNNKLNGAIPSTVHGLRRIQTLRLNNNKISENIPSSVGQMSQLRRVDLSGNSLSGEIPSVLFQLPELQYLSINANSLSGGIPSTIGEAKQLQMLALANNQISGAIPGALFNLNKLQQLDLSGNSFSGTLPEEIGNARSLKQLRLSNNQIEGSLDPALSGLSHLTELTLDRNQLSGTLPDQTRWEMLKVLSLAHNSFTGKIPSSLGKLSHLEALLLGNNDLTDSIPKSLGDLSNLKRLDLSENKLVGEIPQQFGSLLALEELTLDHNLLVGKVPNAIGNLPHLSRIALLGNNFSGEMPSTSSQTDTEKTIWISDNQYTFKDLLSDPQSLSSSTFIYHRQDSVGKKMTVPVFAEDRVSLEADIDRATNPPSVYQWFMVLDGLEDSVLTKANSESHTLQIDLYEGISGSAFYYKITNPGLPDFELVSHRQTLMVLPFLAPCQAYRPLPSYAFLADWDLAEKRSLEGQLKKDSINREIIVQKYLEFEASKVYPSFLAKRLTYVAEQLSHSQIPAERGYELTYYDLAGNVTGKEFMDSKVRFRGGDTSTKQWEYQATYNSRNLPMWQSSKLDGQMRSWYNIAGDVQLQELVGNTSESHWRLIKYDGQERITEVGVTGPWEENEIVALQDDGLYPQKPMADQMVYEYDQYSDADKGWEASNVRNKMVVSKRYSGDTKFKTYYSYDVSGQLQDMQLQNPGMDSKFIKNVHGALTGSLLAKIYQPNQSDQLIQHYTYTPSGKLGKVHSSTDGFIWNQEAEYQYYPNGLMARMELGNYRVEKVDYVYALRDFLLEDNMFNAYVAPLVKTQDHLFTALHDLGKNSEKIGQDAFGRVVQQQVEDENTSYQLDFIRDHTGEVVAVYQDGQWIGHTLRGTEALGIYFGNAKRGSFVLGERAYSINTAHHRPEALISDGLNTAANEIEESNSSSRNHILKGESGTAQHAHQIMQYLRASSHETSDFRNQKVYERNAQGWSRQSDTVVPATVVKENGDGLKIETSND